MGVGQPPWMFAGRPGCTQDAQRLSVQATESQDPQRTANPSAVPVGAVINGDSWSLAARTVEWSATGQARDQAFRGRWA